MRIKSIAHASVLAVVAALSSTAFAANFTADFTGNFHCAAFDLDLKDNAGQCDGTVTMGGNKMPATAVIADDHLAGSFTSQGKDFAFTAVLRGDVLKFTTGSTTYTLVRPVTAANPLAAAQNPLAAAQPADPLATPGASSAPSEIKVLATTETGKTLFIEKPSARSAQAALQSAISDLTKYFGTKPSVSGAFADSQQDTRGGAMFTVYAHGRSLRGVLLCGGGAKGEVVTVTYATANASPNEWATLTAALPQQEKMQTIQFPDNSGSVDVPDGWTTPNNTVMGGVVVNGPSDEKVSLSQSIEVVTPDSQTVRMQRQLEMNARQLGMQPPPPMRMLIAPYTTPTEALQNLIPQISRFSEANGGPTVELDKIISSQDAPACLPNGKASLIDYTWIRTTNGQSVKMRTLAQMECYPILQGSWAIFFSALAAPEKSYDRNLATMWAIARSFKVNDAVVAEKTNQQIQASNQRFAAFQETMKEKNDAFHRFEQSMRARSESQSKCNADFDEVIRGYRTVEDTNTGERTSVDLGKVDEVVNKLNEGDPGRYKQIPLRDE